jgi:hypothetical protein
MTGWVVVNEVALVDSVIEMLDDEVAPTCAGVTPPRRTLTKATRLGVSQWRHLDPFPAKRKRDPSRKKELPVMPANPLYSVQTTNGSFWHSVGIWKVCQACASMRFPNFGWLAPLTDVQERSPGVGEHLNADGTYWDGDSRRFAALN